MARAPSPVRLGQIAPAAETVGPTRLVEFFTAAGRIPMVSRVKAPAASVLAGRIVSQIIFNAQYCARRGDVAGLGWS